MSDLRWITFVQGYLTARGIELVPKWFTAFCKTPDYHRAHKQWKSGATQRVLYYLLDCAVNDMNEIGLSKQAT